MSEKETVSAEEMAQALWKMCGSLTEDFYTTLTPKFQAQGFLREPAENDAFALEALQLHLWIISYVFTDDGAVLDALYNIFALWDEANCQARASQTVQERFALYDEACHRDIEMKAKGLTPSHLKKAALKRLLNKPDEITVSWLTGVEVNLALWNIFPAVEEFRAQFTIRNA